MLELAAEILPLLRAGTPVAVVTVARVIRSAPRGVGASLAVTADMRVIGSISGGCVENDAVLLGLETLHTGRASIARFGFGDDGSLPAALACGGGVDVVAYRLGPEDAAALAVLERIAGGEAASVGIVTTGPCAGQILDDDRFADATGNRMLTAAYDGADVLVLSQAPPARLLILGAGEHAAALCRVASAAGFAVTVCDAWALLVTPERFPGARELIVASPNELLQNLDPSTLDERTAVCVLTHDEREDVPALRVALGLPVGFVGAMGARSTAARRAALLRGAGVAEHELARIHSPLGLDLGGSSPDETAVAIVAEIIASRRGGTSRSLRETDGPIHRGRTAPVRRTPAPAAP